MRELHNLFYLVRQKTEGVSVILDTMEDVVEAISGLIHVTVTTHRVPDRFTSQKEIEAFKIGVFLALNDRLQ